MPAFSWARGGFLWAGQTARVLPVVLCCVRHSRPLLWMHTNPAPIPDRNPRLSAASCLSAPSPLCLPPVVMLCLHFKSVLLADCRSKREFPSNTLQLEIGTAQSLPCLGTNAWDARCGISEPVVLVGLPRQQPGKMAVALKRRWGVLLAWKGMPEC